jgi:hypothetical protein
VVDCVLLRRGGSIGVASGSSELRPWTNMLIHYKIRRENGIRKSARLREEDWFKREGTGMPGRSEFNGECRRGLRCSRAKSLQPGGGASGEKEGDE